MDPPDTARPVGRDRKKHLPKKGKQLACRERTRLSRQRNKKKTTRGQTKPWDEDPLPGAEEDPLFGIRARRGRPIVLHERDHLCYGETRFFKPASFGYCGHCMEESRQRRRLKIYEAHEYLDHLDRKVYSETMKEVRTHHGFTRNYSDVARGVYKYMVAKWGAVGEEVMEARFMPKPWWREVYDLPLP